MKLALFSNFVRFSQIYLKNNVRILILHWAGNLSALGWTCFGAPFWLLSWRRRTCVCVSLKLLIGGWCWSDWWGWEWQRGGGVVCMAEGRGVCGWGQEPEVQSHQVRQLCRANAGERRWGWEWVCKAAKGRKTDVVIWQLKVGEGEQVTSSDRHIFQWGISLKKAAQHRNDGTFKTTMMGFICTHNLLDINS